MHSVCLRFRLRLGLNGQMVIGWYTGPHSKYKFFFFLIQNVLLWLFSIKKVWKFLNSRIKNRLVSVVFFNSVQAGTTRWGRDIPQHPPPSKRTTGGSRRGIPDPPLRTTQKNQKFPCYICSRKCSAFSWRNLVKQNGGGVGGGCWDFTHPSTPFDMTPCCKVGGSLEGCPGLCSPTDNFFYRFQVIFGKNWRHSQRAGGSTH